MAVRGGALGRAHGWGPDGVARARIPRGLLPPPRRVQGRRRPLHPIVSPRTRPVRPHGVHRRCRDRRMHRAVVRVGARPRRRGRRAAGAQRQHGEDAGRRRDAPHRRGAGRAFRVRQSAGHRERGSVRVVPRRGAHAHAPSRAPRPRGYLRPSVGPRRGPDAGRRQGHDAVHGRRA